MKTNSNETAAKAKQLADEALDALDCCPSKLVAEEARRIVLERLKATAN